MKIQVIGCGNAFSNVNFNQSYLLTEDFEGATRTLAIDCGAKFQDALLHAKIPVTAIDDIYISHLHADHTGGMEYFAFSRYDWVKKPRPKRAEEFSSHVKAPHLYCEEALMNKLWTHSLRGGMETIEGTVATLGTFFILHEVSVNEGFKWQGWHFDIVQQVHIMSGKSFAPAWGLICKKPGHKSIYFTTDSQHCSPNQIEVFYNDVDVIFQDCEIDCFLSGVHANYIQLAGYPEANRTVLSNSIRAKMKLSHYQDFYTTKQKRVHKGSIYPFYRLDDSAKDFSTLVDFDWDAQAKKDGFDEFVRVGNIYDTNSSMRAPELGPEPRYPEDREEWRRINRDTIEKIEKQTKG